MPSEVAVKADEIARRIAGLILRPAEEWEAIARRPVPVEQLIAGYLLPLSLLPPGATLIGMRFFDASWDAKHGYLVRPDQIVPAVLVTLAASVATVFVLAAIFWSIAPMYRARRNYLAALNVAILGTVPVWVSGVALVLPSLVLVSMVALCHTLFLYFLGAGQLLGVERDSRADFIGVSLVLLAMVSTLLGAVASRLGLF